MKWSRENLWKLFIITLKAPHPQNDQTHSYNSSAVADKLFERVSPFCGVGASRIVILLQLGMLHPEARNLCMVSLFSLDIYRNILSVKSQVNILTKKKLEELMKSKLGNKWACNFEKFCGITWVNHHLKLLELIPFVIEDTMKVYFHYQVRYYCFVTG